MTKDEYDEYMKKMQDNLEKMDSFIDAVVNELAELERKEQNIIKEIGNNVPSDTDLNNLPPEVKKMVAEAQAEAKREGERRSREFMANMNFNSSSNSSFSSASKRGALGRRGMLI